MRNLILFVALLSALVFCAFPSQSGATSNKHSATVRLAQPVLLNGIVLVEGEYVFVHDDAAMERGEACTFVYKGAAQVRDRLVTSFHCIPEQRKKATHFVVRTATNKSGMEELKEYQFSGQTESHLVPMP